MTLSATQFRVVRFMHEGWRLERASGRSKSSPRYVLRRGYETRAARWPVVEWLIVQGLIREIPAPGMPGTFALSGEGVDALQREVAKLPRNRPRPRPRNGTARSNAARRKPEPRRRAAPGSGGAR